MINIIFNFLLIAICNKFPIKLLVVGKIKSPKIKDIKKKMILIKPPNFTKNDSKKIIKKLKLNKIWNPPIT